MKFPNKHSPAPNVVLAVVLHSGVRLAEALQPVWATDASTESEGGALRPASLKQAVQEMRSTAGEGDGPAPEGPSELSLRLPPTRVLFVFKVVKHPVK